MPCRYISIWHLQRTVIKNVIIQFVLNVTLIFKNGINIPVNMSSSEIQCLVWCNYQYKHYDGTNVFVRHCNPFVHYQISMAQ